MPDADATDNAMEKWWFSTFQQSLKHSIRDSICKKKICYVSSCKLKQEDT